MIAILVALDIYSFQAFKVLSEDWSFKGWVRWGFWILHIAFYVFFITMGTMREMDFSIPTWVFPWLVSLFVLLYLPKLILVAILIGEDTVRAVRKLWQVGTTPKAAIPLDGGGGGGLEVLGRPAISRKKFISMAGIIAAGIPFAATLWGMLRTKYNYAVHKIQIPIKNLPDAFNGFTITQLSDIHSGSFDNNSAVESGVELANKQNSDVIFFTGDLVNSRSEEVIEYKEIFSKLSAPLGVYSITGNHDYGDYVKWDKPEDKAADFANLLQHHKDMGWKVMMNENKIIERDGCKLAIIGIENWSASRHFPTYGDLPMAYKGAEDAEVKVLLSHDPTSWDGLVRKEFSDIDLTLSGHTHGFQFGIEIPGFVKWSPVQYVYEQWAGLYSKGKQHLYVNRGYGFLGFSGRVGIRPEITVLELVKA